MTKNYHQLYPRQLTAVDYTNEETYRYTRPHVSAAMTIHPDAFTSTGFYAIEQERIFANSWIAVGCFSDLQKLGDVIVSDVAGQSIIVTRNKDGQLRAFYNVCRHRGAKMLDHDCTHVRSARIRCPYHSWAFDLDGNCIGTPLFEGSDIPEDQRGIFDMGGVDAFDRADYGLFNVRVESWGFLIFVNLNPDAAPLAQQLGDLPQRFAGYRLEEWVVAREKIYDMQCNYKLVGENFMEYYHLPWVHPELIKVSRMEDHYRWQGPGMYTGMTTTPISQNSDSGGWLGLPPLSTLSEANRIAARFIWLFPNIAINVMPNHCFIMMANPAGPNRTIERCRLLVHPESEGNEGREAAIDDLLHFWDLVNIQDVDIVERVQAGLTMRPYVGGRMCYHFEEPLHRYQNMVIDKMVGIDRIPPGDAKESVPMFVNGNGDS